MAAKVSVRVRMYRMHELGDCHLITFKSGQKTSQLLIDCGTFQNSNASKARLTEVVSSVKAELKGKPLDVLVGTHQHNDHLCGFVHNEADFRAMKVNQVWLSWLDNPRDALAQTVGEKYHNLKSKIAKAAMLMTARGVVGGPTGALAKTEELLGFFGATKDIGTPAELPARATEVLRGIGSNTIAYLKPGTSLDMPGMPAGAVRVHVLGPPHDQPSLERDNPRQGESYDTELTRALSFSARFLDALESHGGSASQNEREYPFSETNKRAEKPSRAAIAAGTDRVAPSANLMALIARYRAADAAWRLVDDDWLDQAAGSALWLDGYTNNSSLVLAIELVASGKVLLFAADAQTGNWNSWKDVPWTDTSVTTDDLLARTVLYKVGHHGSHNSTLKPVFEKMTHPHLSALIPVDKTDSHITKTNGWKMPAKNLFQRIREKTANRVLQMDGVNPPECDLATKAARDAWAATGMKPVEQPLFIEVAVQ